MVERWHNLIHEGTALLTQDDLLGAIARFDRGLAQARVQGALSAADDAAFGAGSFGLGRCLQALGREDDAMPHLRAAHAALRRVVEGDEAARETYFLCLVALGNALLVVGADAEATAFLEEGSRLAPPGPYGYLGRNSLASAHHGLAVLYSRAERYDLAFEASMRAAELVRYGDKGGRLDHLMVAAIHHELGMHRAMRGESVEAAGCFERALESLALHADARGWAQRSLQRMCHLRLVETLRAAGCLEGSLRSARALVELDALGDEGGVIDREALARSTLEVAHLLADLGRLEDARREFTVALQRLDAAPATPSLLALRQQGLADGARCALALGRLDEALDGQRRRLDAARAGGEWSTFEVASAHAGAAAALARMGRSAEAQAHLTAATELAARCEPGAATNELRAALVLEQGLMLARLGRPDAATDWLLRALTLRAERDSAASAATRSEGEGALAWSLAVQGRVAEALPWSLRSVQSARAGLSVVGRDALAERLEAHASLLDRLGRVDEARAYSEEIAALPSPTPAALASTPPGPSGEGRALRRVLVRSRDDGLHLALVGPGGLPPLARAFLRVRDVSGRDRFDDLEGSAKVSDVADLESYAASKRPGVALRETQPPPPEIGCSPADTVYALIPEGAAWRRLREAPVFAIYLPPTLVDPTRATVEVYLCYWP